MIQTAEQILESVRALPQMERQKFFDLAEAEKQINISENGSTVRDLDERNIRFKKAQKWIEEHKEEYDGQIICLYGDELIASGYDARSVYQQGKSRGIKSPFIHRVKAKELPFGGW